MLLAPILITLAAAAAAPAQERSPVSGDLAAVDQLVAIVNDQTLTRQDIEIEVVRFAQERGIAPETPGIARVIARNMITDMLFAEGFRQAGLDETIVDQIVSDEIKRKIQDFGSLASYERHLASIGRNIAVERRTIRQTIVATYFQQAELGIAPELGGTNYRSFITVSPAEIQKYYEAKNGQFRYPRLTNVRILMVRGGDNETVARKIIEDARAASATDALAFARAAEAHSVFGKSRQNLTGLVDPATEGQVSSFRDFLATAEAGQISAIVKKSGYLVAAQAHQVQPEKQLTIGEAHRQIESELLEDKRLQALDKALNRQRKRCYVWTIPELSGILDNVYGLRDASEEEL
ncbi:MAG: peptidyl-prolyl cis-trans isomerase [Planctomycetes bacterium]|nr:peptidyl-prolyl cis-trans isomerase [Planctomycetota bacterium]